MTVTAFVEPNSDVLIVDVTGADPNAPQTALLKLWAPRTPSATAKGRVGLLAQAWLDNRNPESSDRAFGSLSAITADGRDVSVSITDALTVTVSSGLLQTDISESSPRPLITTARETRSRSLRGHCWSRQTLCTHPVARFLESRRSYQNHFQRWRRRVYGESPQHLSVCRRRREGVEYPGSQAGVADMISAAQDTHKWDPSAFWHWNLRMQVAANIGAGLTELNEPYFNLYRENLTNIENWTKAHMSGLPACVCPRQCASTGVGLSMNPVGPQSLWA